VKLLASFLTKHQLSPNNSKISDREKEVLILIAHEKTSKEIADALFISLHTALSHRKNLLQKLNAKNTAGLVRRGFEMGLLTLINSSIENKKI